MPAWRFRTRGASAVAGFSLLASALSGCSSGVPVPTSASGFPTDTAPPLLAVTLAPVPSFTGYAPPLNAVTTTIDWPDPVPDMRYPMDWLAFSVTVANDSDFAFKQVAPVVVLGLCTCNPARHDLRPFDVMEVWDPTLNDWRGINSAIQKPDGSFTFIQQIPPLDIGAGASVTVKYRIELANPAKEAGLVTGTGSLNVYVLQLPGHERLATRDGPDAAEPLAYNLG